MRIAAKPSSAAQLKRRAFFVHSYLVIVAWALLAGAGWRCVRRVALVMRSTTTAGRVESHEARQMAGDSTAYFPVVAFKDARGRWHRFTASAGSARPRPSAGSAVVVHYQGEDPRSAVVASFIHMWGESLALAALGASCMLAVVLS